jgi:hypothetical protein
MPMANKKPTPSTIPYPQACPKGEAEGPVGAGPPAIVVDESRVLQCRASRQLRNPAPPQQHAQYL